MRWMAFLCLAALPAPLPFGRVVFLTLLEVALLAVELVAEGP